MLKAAVSPFLKLAAEDIIHLILQQPLVAGHKKSRIYCGIAVKKSVTHLEPVLCLSSAPQVLAARYKAMALGDLKPYNIAKRRRFQQANAQHYQLS